VTIEIVRGLAVNDHTTMSDPFIDQLAHLCHQHPTRAKWVFVPSHAIGRVIGERLALSGTNWLNLHFVTPLDIALRMGAPFLVERGIDPSEEGLGPALIMRLLLALPGEGGYFRPLADQPRMAQALWSTIRELRMAGVNAHGKADSLPADAFESPAKHAELRELLAAYEHFLAANHRGDMATVYEEAVTHPDWCPIQPADCWTELPDVIWTPLQQRLLDILPGERITPRALALPGVTVPRRLVGVPAAPAEAGAISAGDNRPLIAGADRPRATGVERMAPDAATTPLAFLLSPHDMPHASRAGAATLNLYVAGGREAEIEEACRRILAAGVSLDQVEVVCASSDHLALMWEKALRHDWPVTLGPGIPAASTRSGRALVGLCDWIETDFSASHLRHLLQSGDMGLEKDDEAFTAGEAARTLMRAEAGWGRATYALALGGLRKGYDTRAADRDLSDDDRELAREKSTLTSAVLAWTSGLLASIPEPAADGHVPLQQVVGAALNYLDRTTARSCQLDHRAAAALIDHVAELQSLDGFACPLPAALRFIRERVLTLHVAPERPRPESLHICTVPQAGYSGRSHVFVVGLEEGRVFPAAIEDAVLLDRERAAISPALRRSADRIDEAVYAMLARLATCGATSTVTFSYSVRDTREFRETYASWLMLQAFRLQQGNATATYHDMKAALGEPVSSIPPVRDRALSDAGWWLRGVVGSGDGGVDAVTSTFTRVARGRLAEAARASEAFTEFDGHVPEAGKALDPCAPHNAFSVTDLEAAAECPFRMFLKRGLGLRPVDERERDRDVWLAPMIRGAELHDIYATALRRCRDAKRRPSQKQDAAWLRKLVDGRLDELRRQMPPATDEIFERESKDFIADVELFLEVECEPTMAELLGFEVSFGRPLTDQAEVLARAEPVEIALGSGLTLRIAGRIDRIDKVGPTSFEILDYKTGGFYRPEWNGTFKGGRRLQHALYGLAAVELLRAHYKKPTVTEGVYYFSSRKGGGERVPIKAPSEETLATVVGDLRELILNGGFVHAPKESDCKFCDFKAACVPDVHAQSNAKLNDATLSAYARLTAHD
jgi:RecB family exonuclease